MKKISFVLAISVFLGSYLYESSTAEEKSVNATITPLVISLSLSPSTVSYGTRQANAGDVPSNPLSIVVTNTGSGVQDFKIAGANSTSGDWTLAASAGQDQFVHRFSTSGSSFTDLSTSFAALQSNVAAAGNFDLYLQLVVPTTITKTAVQTLPVKILAIQDQ